MTKEEPTPTGNRPQQTMTELELLAPARDLECGIAAIDHGADAVYIGAPRFGARAAAGNSTADIEALCRYAHGFGARIYVTLNTIVYDSELESVRRTLSEIERAGADAVLVQDMAVARMLQDSPMAAHASTQADCRTAGRVAWLRGCGFSRVVLARELSADEIAAIHSAVPDVELEVFVHGALCVSFSGQCYTSQHCFGRSANRGECAQFCRLKFSLCDASGHKVAPDAYYLSLKDMNQSANLERLVSSGATSFKIEGRLKDAAYVKNVTAAYSRRLNDIVRKHPGQYRRASYGVCRYAFEPNLEKTFNRGFTTYFATGRQPGMASTETPKARGEFVGRVKETRGAWLTVAGVAPFANGDGLCFVNTEGRLEGFRVNRAENNRLFPLKMPAGLRPGTALYRNNDQAFERMLSGESSVRKVPLSMSLGETDGGFELTAAVCGGGPSVSVAIKAGRQEARSPQRDNIVRQLTRLGGTRYECSEVSLPDGFNLFIPSSALAAARREAVLRLEEETAARLAATRRKRPDTGAAVPHYAGPDYLYNVSNGEARRFYAAHGLGTVTDAFEQHEPQGAVLMQCRYCLRHELGFCERRGGRTPRWQEPLSLALPDGRRFRLEFDCRRCQMNVYAAGHDKNNNRT